MKSLLAGVMSMLAAAATAAETPLEVYGKLPSLEDLALSPDGTKLAYVRTVGDERILSISQLGQTEPIGGARVGDVKLRSIEWMDDDDLEITVSATSLPPVGFLGPRSEWFQAVVYRISKRALVSLPFERLDQRTLNVITSAPMVRYVDGRTLMFVRGYVIHGETLPALFRYDVGSGVLRIVAESSLPGTEWLVDASGQIAAVFIYDDRREQWTLSVRRQGRMEQVATGAAAVDVPRMLGFDTTGEAILFRFIEGETQIWRPWLINEGRWGEALAKGKSFERAIKNPRTDRIIGGSHGSDDHEYYFFDNELQAHWDSAVRPFPALERIDLVSASSDYLRLIVRVFGPKDGYRYFMFDWYTHRLAALPPVYEGLDHVGEVRRLRYPAADGREIPAYVTLPPGTSDGAAQLPLVVLPHGGPAVADSWRFDWWAQALAARGYVVLQPNYRGSDLGRAHLAAGFGEWGRKMQTDLSDGVRYLAGQGLIDPKRVCIVGASYGGYAALAGMALQAGVYRCAVSVAGVSDLKRMMHWVNSNAGRSNNLTQRYWDRYMGVTGPADPKLMEISPIEHVDAVAGPVLLIHGRDDTVVPFEQSEVMEKALRRAGKTVTLVTLKREDHWLSRSVTRLQMLEATVDFLKANNPSAAAPPAAAPSGPTLPGNNPPATETP